jgi:hypothetical protein
MAAGLQQVHALGLQRVLGGGNYLWVAVDVVWLAEHEHASPERSEGGWVE